MIGCYVSLNTIKDNVAIELPSYPDELSDNTSANWADQTIVGRSSPIAAFTGTGYRNVSFNFLMHREMANNIEEVIKFLRSTVYPSYQASGLIPPITTFRFGAFRIKGIVRSVGFVFKKPIINEVYQLCEVSINIDSTPENVIDVDYIMYSSSAMNPMND